MVQINPAKKKSTFFLSEDLLSEIKALIPMTGLRSQNAVVEEALRSYIAQIKRDVVRQQYLEASRDPLFLSDVEEMERDFRYADAETARMIP